MLKVIKARVTSKNQVTLPQALVRRLGVRAGDDLRFEIGEDGTVRVTPPRFADRAGPWVGFLRRDGEVTRAERDAFVREMRGDVDE